MGMHGEVEPSPNVLGKTDRRQFPRFHVYQDTLLYNQDSFAEILDISSGGLACRSHVGLENGPDVISGLELLNCNIGLKVEGLNCRRVRNYAIVAGAIIPKADEPVCFYEFVDLNSRQVSELDTFIKSCARKQRPNVVFV